MLREYKAYFRDILEAIGKIERYTKNMDFKEFVKNELIQDGVVRNLELIGEAVKYIPENIKKNHPEIEWRKVAGLRDILIHAYFGIDLDVLWDIVKNKIPALKKNIKNILLNLDIEIQKN